MKIKKREDVDPKEGKDKYGDVKFADPTNSKYPIDTEEHIRAAWNYINKRGNAGEYGDSEVAQIKRRIIAAWKEHIDPKGPPSAAQSANAGYAFNFGSIGKAPESIMYMPAGKATILPTVNGKPKEITVNVDAQTAETLQDAFEELMAENVKPTIDFDHKGEGAAAWPMGFRWVEGQGVYLDLNWTNSGRQAVEGKDYQYFSPSFLVTEDGQPMGLPSSGPIGALTNNPAFREIQRIAASRNNKPGSSAVDDENDTVMSAKIKQALVDHGVLDAADLDEGDDKIVPKLKKRLKAMQDDADASKQQMEDAKAELATIRKDTAEAAVQAAINEGKLPPKSDDAKRFYVEAYQRDPEATRKAIAALPVNPALQRLVKIDGTNRTHQTAATVESTGDVDRDLQVRQQAVLADLRTKHPKISADALFALAAQAAPELDWKN